MRRRASEVECIGAPTCVPTAKEAEQEAVYPYRRRHRYGCPRWDVDEVTPSWDGLRPHRVFLGSKRMPYATWVKSASMYTWPLWRNWTGPKVVKVETGAEVFARHLRGKPYGPVGAYGWKLEKLTPAERLALGCLPKPPTKPAVWKLRNRTVDADGHVRWERRTA